jgi:hypothetical protein
MTVWFYSSFFFHIVRILSLSLFFIFLLYPHLKMSRSRNKSNRWITGIFILRICYLQIAFFLVLLLFLKVRRGKVPCKVLCANTGRNTFDPKILTANYKHHMRWNLLQNFDCTSIPPQPPFIHVLLSFSLFSNCFISHIFLFLPFKKFPFSYFTLPSFFIVFCVPLSVCFHWTQC